MIYPKRDRRGKSLRTGQIVRIVGVPDLAEMLPSSRRETLPVFRHLVGKYKRVVGFNELNEVEISFGIKKGRYRGLHSVWIEPHLVQIKSKRSVARSKRRTSRSKL
jgi:hypothetical protein